jgi:hypothetical protein
MKPKDLVAWIHEEFGISLDETTVSPDLKSLGNRKLSARPATRGKTRRPGSPKLTPVANIWQLMHENWLVQPERFVGGSWDAFDDGVPFLTEAQYSIRCPVDGTFDYGPHAVFIVRARAIRVSDLFRPLVYGDGGYHHLQPVT